VTHQALHQEVKRYEEVDNLVVSALDCGHGTSGFCCFQLMRGVGLFVETAGEEGDLEDLTRELTQVRHLKQVQEKLLLINLL
jgi:hypothetical protein